MLQYVESSSKQEELVIQYTYTNELTTNTHNIKSRNQNHKKHEKVVTYCITNITHNITQHNTLIKNVLDFIGILYMFFYNNYTRVYLNFIISKYTNTKIRDQKISCHLDNLW